MLLKYIDKEGLDDDYISSKLQCTAWHQSGVDHHHHRHYLESAKLLLAARWKVKL